MNQNFSYNYEQIPTPENINPYSGNIGKMMVSPNNKPSVDEFMYKFNKDNREQFNDYWFQRNDEDLIEGMKQVILSCQRDKYFVLKVLNFETIKDYNEINRTLYEYYSSKTKNGKKIDNNYEYINLRDSDIMLLKVIYYVKLNVPDNKIRVDNKTGELEKSEGIVNVLIALPRYVDKYYFRILGNYYNPIFQIVDGSTYNNSTSNSKTQSITLKTQFMPIKVYKEYYDLVDMCDKESHRCVLFASYVFTKKTDTIKFILGRYGFYGALEMLELEAIYIQPYENGEPIKDEEGNEITEPMRKIKDEYMEEYQKTVGELNGKLNEIAYEDNEVDIATIDFDTFIDGLPDESKIDFDDITMLSFMDTTTNVIDDKEVE